MIHIVEFYRTGIEHLAFNTAAIKAIRSAYPDEAVKVYGESGLLTALKIELADSPCIEFVELKIAPRNASKWRRLGKDFSIMRQLKRVMAPEDRCLLLSVSPAAILSLVVLRLKPRVLGVIHANLAVTLHKPRFNLTDRWFRERVLVRYLPKNIRCCVLERGVAVAAGGLMPELKGRLAVLPHPVPEGVAHKVSSVLEKPMHIGLCGLLTPQKGLQQMARLAEIFHQQGAVFHLHGRLHQSVGSNADYSHFDTPPSTDRIERKAFVARMASLDFGAFFFTGQYYELTASGVLLDFIALGLPLFGYKNSTIVAIEHEYGPIGWFCEPGAEASLLSELLSSDIAEDYRLRHNNLLSVAARRTVQETGVTLKSLYKSL